MTWNASSPTASSRSRWATSIRPRRSATPASRPTPSAPTRTRPTDQVQPDRRHGEASPRRSRARERAHSKCVSERAETTTREWPARAVIMSARRSVSRVLSLRPPKRTVGMAIHLWPPVAQRLLRPTRGLGSAPLPRTGRPARVTPSYSALLRVEFAAFHSAGRPESRSAASSLWHWSSSRDGRALPATLR